MKVNNVTKTVIQFFRMPGLLLAILSCLSTSGLAIESPAPDEASNDGFDPKESPRYRWKNDRDRRIRAQTIHQHLVECTSLVESSESPQPDHLTKVTLIDSQGFLQQVVYPGDGHLPIAEIPDKFTDGLIDKDLSEHTIFRICECYRQKLVDHGFFLAEVQPETKDIREGKLSISFSSGVFGKVDFQKGDPPEESLKPIYRERLIRRKLSFEEDDFFDYLQLQDDLSRINRYPFFSLDTSLKIQAESEDNKNHRNHSQNRTVDIDLIFRKSEVFTFPVLKRFNEISFSTQVDNTGSDETDEWRLQLNLYKPGIISHFDSLTTNLATALDGTLYSGSGQYSVPFAIPWSLVSPTLTIFGGASDIDVEDVIESLDNEGDGWFAGASLTINDIPLPGIIESALPDSKLSMSFGFTRRSTTNRLRTEGVNLVDREISITPFNLGFNFSNHKFDALWGKNSLAYTFQINVENTFASSNAKEFDDFRSQADGNYKYSRVHFSRIQKLHDEETNPWIMYIKGDAQITDDRLVSIEQKAVGGFDSVRGYSERNFFGDKGVSGSIELRMPHFSERISESEEGEDSRVKPRPRWTIQPLLFYDFARIEINNAQPGEINPLNLSSTGIGLRMSFFTHFQLRFDYGYALKKISGQDIDDDRFHVVLKAGF